MKKKIIILIFINSLIISCNSKAKNEKIETSKSNDLYQDKLYERYVPLMNKLLINNHYTHPSHQDFRNKIIDYFGVDIDTSRYNDVNASNTAVVLKNEKIIDTYSLDRGDIDGAGDAFSEILKEGTNNDYNTDFVNYNKVLFNDDELVISKISNDIDKTEDILIYMNYEKSNLLNVAFVKNLKKADDYNDDFKWHLLWYNNRNKNEIIRKKIISEIINKNPEFIFELAYFLHANGDKMKEIESKIKDKTLAYLIEIELKFYDVKDLNDNKGYSLLNNFYVQSPELLNKFKSNNFYNYNLLDKYTQTYLSMSSEKSITSYGRIVDLDGFTNLRKEKNSKSDIIEKVKSGENIEILDDSGNWWFVKTKSGNEGYIFKNKILVKN